MIRLVSLGMLLAAATFAAGDDAHCPAYPSSARAAQTARIENEKAARTYSLARQSLAAGRVAVPPSNNIIDDPIFGKMARDGVEPAPVAGDEEIFRRLFLDLTGRIPTAHEAAVFFSDPDPAKRTRWIDRLMQSEAFVDYWTFFYANHFEITTGYYDFITIPGRNLFYQHLRAFVANRRSYRELATELVTASGDANSNGPANFAVRGIQQGDPIQDTYDALTDRITTKFLGVQTQCVSCHNGERHLEPINLYLTSRKRDEFWRQSAFLARTSIAAVPGDFNGGVTPWRVQDRATGAYTVGVDPNNPGPRPTRTGGPYSAQYLFTGEPPQSGNWRGELARILTSDRQFARAAVNYLWAHFFKYGIVDPPDGWDLARIDPSNPPPRPWALQASHPELLEALADEFIRSDYNFARIVKLIAESNAYQLSSRYAGTWRPEYELYFAKHFPRRLTAEEIWDALTVATGTEVPMFVEGFAKPLYFATQLPDVTEPRNSFTVSNFLSTFGRGDWWTLPRRNSSDVLESLFQMNDSSINNRTFGNRNVPTNVTRVMQLGLSDTDAINALFRATLGRYCTDEEYAVIRARKTTNYEQWLSDVQWALLNKAEFVFSN